MCTKGKTGSLWRKRERERERETMGLGLGELGVSDLCRLVSKVEAAAAKAADNEAEKARAIDLLNRIGKDLRSTEVLAEAQKKERAGKRLRRLASHECLGVASTANRVLTEIKKKFRKDEGVAQGVAQFKSAERVAAAKPKIKLVKSEEPSSRPSVPVSTGGQKPAGGNPVSKAREVVKKALVEGLKLACGECGKGVEVAENVATELEEELHQKYNCSAEGPEKGKISKEYKLKYRSLSFNLKDKSNPDLRRRVLLGEIPCKDIVTWNVYQLASDKRKEDNVEIKKVALLNSQARKPTVSSTDQFKCGKCKQRKCTYYQMQTRSADEPMTTFVTCTNCNNRWKFS